MINSRPAVGLSQSSMSSTYAIDMPIGPVHWRVHAMDLNSNVECTLCTTGLYNINSACSSACCFVRAPAPNQADDKRLSSVRVLRP